MASLVNEQMVLEDPRFHILRTRWSSFMELCRDAARANIVSLEGDRGHLRIVHSKLTQNVGAASGAPVPYEGVVDEPRPESPLRPAREGDDDEYVYDLFVEALKQLATPGPRCCRLPFPARAISDHMSRLDWDWRKRSPRWTNHFRTLCEKMQDEGHVTVTSPNGDLTVVDCKYFDAQGLTIAGIRAASAVAAGIAPPPQYEPRIDGIASSPLYPPRNDGMVPAPHHQPRNNGFVPPPQFQPRNDGSLARPRTPHRGDEEVIDTAWAALKNVNRRVKCPFAISRVSDELRLMQHHWSLKGTGFKSFHVVMEALESRGLVKLRKERSTVLCDVVYEDGRRRYAGEDTRRRSNGRDRRDDGGENDNYPDDREMMDAREQGSSLPTVAEASTEVEAEEASIGEGDVPVRGAGTEKEESTAGKIDYSVADGADESAVPARNSISDASGKAGGAMTNSGDVETGQDAVTNDGRGAAGKGEALDSSLEKQLRPVSQQADPGTAESGGGSEAAGGSGEEPSQAVEAESAASG
jgi:hypothetical protein